MQNHYFVTGAWGVKFNNSTILRHWAVLMVSNFGVGADAEAESIRTALTKMVDQSYSDLENELLKNGFAKRDCAWQYLNLCPMKN